MANLDDSISGVITVAVLSKLINGGNQKFLLLFLSTGSYAGGILLCIVHLSSPKPKAQSMSNMS